MSTPPPSDFVVFEGGIRPRFYFLLCFVSLHFIILYSNNLQFLFCFFASHISVYFSVRQSWPRQINEDEEELLPTVLEDPSVPVAILRAQEIASVWWWQGESRVDASHGV